MRASIIIACLILACCVNSMIAQDAIWRSMMNSTKVSLISNSSFKSIGAISLGAIEIGGMPTLLEVCVWPTFPLGVNADAYGIPNVEYKDYGAIGIEKNHESRLAIYPNPTIAILSIDITNPKPHSIQITPLSGQAIYSSKMEAATIQIDLSSLLKEVYLITIDQ